MFSQDYHSTPLFSEAYRAQVEKNGYDSFGVNISLHQDAPSLGTINEAPSISTVDKILAALTTQVPSSTLGSEGTQIKTMPIHQVGGGDFGLISRLRGCNH